MPRGVKRTYNQISKSGNGGNTGNKRNNRNSNNKGNTANQPCQEGPDVPVENTGNTVSTAERAQDSGERPAKQRKQRRRKDEPEEDYSANARRKAENSSRTRQACDRCQGRKLRCDKDLNGCYSCIRAGFVCRHTDRVSGITYERGQMERLQSENQHLRGENVTLRNVLQHLGYYVPVTVPNPPSGQPFQQVTQQAAQPNNSTQQPPQQPAQQTVQSNHATQKGGGGQGQAQGYANYPLTTSNYYPQNTLQQQQQALPTTQQQSTPQRPLAQQQLPQQQMQHIQGQQNQRPLMNTQQVSPQIIQSRPQSQASNIACPPNNGGDFTYPVQPQPAPSFYYNPTSSLPHVSSASMPGTVAGTVADSSSGAILQDNSFSSDMTGLGSGYVQHQGQDQNQGGVGGQTGNHGHTDAFIKPEPSYEGLATEGTYLTDGWTMNGWPLQNTATQQQQQQQTGGYADSQQAATQGTKTQQRANNNQNNQNTYQTYQMNSGRPSYDAQKLQILDQQRNLAGQGSSSQSAQGSSSQNADVQQLLQQLQPLQVFNQQHDSINRNQPVPNQQQSYVSQQSQAFNTQQPQSYQNQYQLQTHVNSTGNTHDGNNGQSQNQVDLTQTTDEDGSDGEDHDDDDDGDYSDDDDEEEDASDGNGVSFTGTDEDHDDGYDSDDDNAGVNTASAANDDNNAIDDPFNNYADDPIMNGWVPELSNFDMDQFLDFAQHADVS